MKGCTPWMKGKHHTKESKEKNRISHLGRKTGCIALKGKHNSLKTEFKKGQKPWNTGKKYTQEMRNKMMMINPNKKAVAQFDSDGNFIAEFISLKEASRKLGCSHSHIADCCYGKIKRFKGFIWRFK